MNNLPAAPTVERLVLDTHSLIWYLEGLELSEAQVQTIEERRQANHLYISAISVWEVAMLINKRKAAISISINEWLQRVLAIPGLQVIDLSLTILIDSCYLPDFEHRDPADRMIVASARAIDGHLLTFDQKILAYAAHGYLKTC